MWPIARRAVDRWRLRGAVEWLGSLAPAEIVSELKATSVYVHPSIVENSPNSLAEAMILGVPCVASSAGGVPSLLKDGHEGLLCSPNDVYGLAGAIGTMATQPARAARLGANARSRARRRHEPRTIAQDTVAMYETSCRVTRLVVHDQLPPCFRDSLPYLAERDPCLVLLARLAMLAGPNSQVHGRVGSPSRSERMGGSASRRGRLASVCLGVGGSGVARGMRAERVAGFCQQGVPTRSHLRRRIRLVLWRGNHAVEPVQRLAAPSACYCRLRWPDPARCRLPAPNTVWVRSSRSGRGLCRMFPDTQSGSGVLIIPIRARDLVSDDLLGESSHLFCACHCGSGRTSSVSRGRRPAWGRR